ncbi:putative serf family protein [Biscogniauxia mediterranea]|nr:putative serf family protein [Biscogniauxia mediterranea]
MARGNQREKAREKNLKAQASQAPAHSLGSPSYSPCSEASRAPTSRFPKAKNSKSGTEMARDKEALAEMMRKKQAAADAKKAAANNGKK